MKRILYFTLIYICCCLANPCQAQLNSCNIRTFFTSTSLTSSVFWIPSIPNYIVDSARWDYGDATIEKKYSPNINGAHNYTNAGTYFVTLEQWGRSYPSGTETFHCTYTDTNFVFSNPTDSLCGGDFKVVHMGSDTVVFSNTSLIHAPSFSSHPLHTNADWDFGNGSTFANTLNDAYSIVYAPGTYNVCLYYSGFSFNNGGYMYNCETCKKVTVAPTSVNDFNKIKFILSPNPASTNLTVQSNIPVSEIRYEIVDITGNKQVISSFQTSEYHTQFNTSNLLSGTYLLNATVNGSVKTVLFTVM